MLFSVCRRVFVLALMTWTVINYAASADAQQRMGKVSIVNPFEVGMPVQLQRGNEIQDRVIPKNTTVHYPIDIDANGRSDYQPRVRFNNGKGQIKDYKLEYYEIKTDTDIGKVYRFVYDEATGWDLKSED